MIRYTTLFLGLFMSLLINAQCPKGLLSYAKDFKAIEAKQFQFLETSLQKVRLVGFGEATHGTTQFTQLAQELMFYLKEQHNYSLLILETGFGEAMFLNDYILGKEEHLANIMKSHNSTWRYETQSFYRFMNALRSYNETHSHKILLFGCEMQFPKADVERLRNYLGKVGSTYLIPKFEKHLWNPVHPEELQTYFNTYQDLSQLFQDQQKDFIAKSSDYEFAIAYRHVTILGQFVSTFMQTTAQRKHDMRDLFMAENIEWILELHDAKGLFWAHNGHIGNWISNGIVDVAGHQLKKRYGDAYFNIATTLGSGSFKAFSKEGKLQDIAIAKAPSQSFTSCLQDQDSAYLYIDLKAAQKNSALKQALDQPLTVVSGAGAYVRKTPSVNLTLGSAFDGLIYLDVTTPIQWQLH